MLHNVVIHQLGGCIHSASPNDANLRRPVRLVSSLAETTHVEAAGRLHPSLTALLELFAECRSRLAYREGMPPGEPTDVHRPVALVLHVEGSVRRQVFKECHGIPRICRRTLRISCRAGWTDVEPRKAGMPARSTASARSAMLFIRIRLPTPFSRLFPRLFPSTPFSLPFSLACASLNGLFTCSSAASGPGCSPNPDRGAPLL